MTKRLKFKKRILRIGFVCMISILCALFSLAPGQEAKAFRKPLAEPSVSNLFLENLNKFNLSSLDQVAVRAGYSNADDLLSRFSGTPILASKFGNMTVNAGSYTALNGSKTELTWIPTYLSKDKSGDVILTLWLAFTESTNTSSNQEVSRYSDGYQLNASGAYSESGTSYTVYSNSYDCSYIRHMMLNGDANYKKIWGQYWNGSTTVAQTATRVTQYSKTQVNKFTMLTSGALSNYIVAPEQVAWQMSLSAGLNDPANGSNANYPNNWTKDKIWLPSESEAWQNALWKVTTAQRANSCETWLRTAGTSDRARGVRIAGSSDEINRIYDVDTYFAVRPAFHLNLTDAVANSVRLATSPSDVSAEFNGTAQTVASAKTAGNTTASWFDATKMTVTAPSNMLNVGTYNCTVALNTSAEPRLRWSDGTTGPKPFQFKITQKSLTVTYTRNSAGLYDAAIDVGTYASADTNRPTNADLVLTYTRQGDSTVVAPPFATDGTYTAHVAWRSDLSPQNYKISNATQNFSYTRLKLTIPTATPASKPYAGSPVSFALSNFDSNEMEIDDGGRGIWDAAARKLTVTDAGKYSVTVRLKNPAEKDWKGGTTADQPITFEVTKARLQATLSGTDGSNSFSCALGSRVDLEVTSDLKTGDAVKLNLYADHDADHVPVAQNVVITSASQTVAIDTDVLQEGYTYTITAELTPETDERNACYTLSILNNVQITVTKPDSTVHVVWLLSHAGTNDSLDAFESESANYAKTLTYDGKPFVWTVNENILNISGYKLDLTYGTNGYLNATQTDAGTTYQVSVRLLRMSDESVYGVYELNWRIDKAKFDLGGVKWRGNGTLVYNGMRQKMELEGLPEGLTAEYGGLYEYKEVNVTVKATVDSFTVADPNNYVEPVSDDPDSYLGSFDWEIEWKIEPLQIRVQWGKDLVTDENGKKFNLSVLRDENFRPIVTHTYYKTDASGNKLDETPIDPTTIEVTEEPVYYICEISITGGDGGYVLNGSTKSPVFAVSSRTKAATFTPNREKFPYIGEAIGVQFTNDAGIKKDGYELKYSREDGTVLPGAPVNVGKYFVEVVLLGDVANNYFIAGDSTFAFEIEGREIAEKWKEDVTPPRLDIYNTEAKLIEYEITDEKGAAVNFADLQAKKTYRIRAKIKAEHAASVSFTGGVSETGWKEFTPTEEGLTNKEDPNDPSVYPKDPNDPNKPIDDPKDPEDPGDPEDPNEPNMPEEPEEFQNIPVWQLAVGGFSLIFGAMFLAKGNGYRAQAKEKRHRAETVRRRASDPNLGMAGFVLGMNETFAGLTGSVWTGMACGLLALCLLAMVWMITGKRKYARASADLEAAEQEAFVAEKRREVAKQLREEEREREREEEQQRRADEMKMMFMMMNKGGGNGGSNEQRTIDATVSTDEVVARVVAQLLPSLQSVLQPAVVQSLPSGDDNAIDELRREQREQRELLNEILHNTRQSAQPADMQYEEHITETVTEMVEEPEPEVYEEVVEEIVEEPQVEEVVEEVIEEQPQVEEVVQVVEEAAAVEEPEEKPKKEKIPAEPKLTLDEAYALLSREQKKFFDGLRAYAMSKEKCKEKKTTYFILCGQSTANPLIKLCIKKDMTVARFKLEDEYTKNVRRNAGSEGTKIKVKETEVFVSDAQAFATAKEMIDIREDQIERYEEFLKEQRLLAKQSK